MLKCRFEMTCRVHADCWMRVDRHFACGLPGSKLARHLVGRAPTALGQRGWVVAVWGGRLAVLGTARVLSAGGRVSEDEVELHVNCESAVPPPCGVQRPIIDAGQGEITSYSLHFSAFVSALTKMRRELSKFEPQPCSAEPWPDQSGRPPVRTGRAHRQDQLTGTDV